jgi:type II secretory pathway pseudopilin PulG
MALFMKIGNNPLDYGVLSKSNRRLKGFTYIGLLIVISIAGIGMSTVGVVWQTEMRREREIELLHIGTEFREAISSYRDATPGGIKQNPIKLEDLILDKRLPIIKRHLRKLYHDPITNSNKWGLVKEQGAIVGVYSLSQLQPIKTSGFPPEYEVFGEAGTYQDWQFKY